jgi:hypothetical protein
MASLSPDVWSLKGTYVGTHGKITGVLVQLDGVDEDGEAHLFKPSSVSTTAPAPPAATSITTKLVGNTPTVDQLPAGATLVKWARSTAETGGTTFYEDAKPADQAKTYAGATSTAPWVGALAMNAQGDVGGWARRIRVTAAAPTPDPVPDPVPQPSGVQWGMCMRNWEDNDRAAWATLQPKARTIVRVGVENTADAQRWIDFYWGLGGYPLVVWEFDAVPSEAAIQQFADVIVANKAKVKAVEMGNELSYSYKGKNASYAQAYARAVKSFSQKVKPQGVGVLGINDDANSGPWWVDACCQAVPDYFSYLTGWTGHYYQPGSEARLARDKANAARYGGANVPPWVTESGISVNPQRGVDESYGWPTNLTGPQAAQKLDGHLDKLIAAGASTIVLYQSTDQWPLSQGTARERYFGLTLQSGAPKDGMTELGRRRLG